MMRISSATYIIFFFSLVGLPVNAQSAYPWLRGGDQLYNEGQYPDAETAYRKALEVDPKPNSSYNLANTMLRQERIPEAIEEYKKAIQSSDQPELRSSAFYNMGNAYFQNNEFEQSINAYKESLKINPTDEDAKKNLMLAMRRLRQQQQEQQKENKQEQQQQQQQEEEQQQQEQPQEQEKQQGESPQEKDQPKKEDVSKEEANEILKAIEREDQRVQEKLKKSAGKTVPPIKDW